MVRYHHTTTLTTIWAPTPHLCKWQVPLIEHEELLEMLLHTTSSSSKTSYLSSKPATTIYVQHACDVATVCIIMPLGLDVRVLSILHSRKPSLAGLALGNGSLGNSGIKSSVLAGAGRERVPAKDAYGA